MDRIRELRLGNSRNSWNRSKELRTTVIILTFFILIGSSVIGWRENNFTIGFFWSVMAYTILMPILFERNLRNNPFHPYSYFTILSLISYALAALTILFGWGLSHRGFSHVFVEAMALIAVSYLLLWFGFRSNIAIRLAKGFPFFVFPQKTISNVANRSILKTALILYGVGWIGRLIKPLIGYSHLPRDIGRFFQFLSMIQGLSLFSQLAFVTILYLVLSSGKKGILIMLLTGCLFILEIMAGLLEGGRSVILLPVLLTAIVYHYTIRRFSWKKICIAFSILLFFFIPLTTVYRNIFYSYAIEDQYGLHVVKNSLLTTPDRFKDYSSWHILISAGLSRLSSHFGGTLRVLERVPEHYKFQKGATFLPDLFIFFIPRLIWPDKPIFRQGRKFAIEFWDYPEGAFGTSTGIGLPAELYYNFGWLGLLLCPLWGVMIRFFCERFKYYSRKESIPIIRLIFIIFTAGGILGHILGFWTGIIREGLFYYTFMILLYRRLPEIIFVRRVSP